MKIRLGVVMDPIQAINYKKDSTLSMLWEAEARNWEIYYIEQPDLFLRDGIPYADARKLSVFKDPKRWFNYSEKETIALSELQIILMRKDPPFNAEYIYTTHLLQHAENLGVLVVNRPSALRDCNEKLFATYFPNCSPPSIVTQSIQKLWEFWQEHGDIVCKPLDSMGGYSIFRLKPNDVNSQVIFETLTRNAKIYIIAQRFIPEITNGDKRILMIHGEPIPFGLARIPQGRDWRGNLAVGAKGVVQPLTVRDYEICTQVAPELKSRGIYFAGLDVIGDYLTEINITSPTCIREIDDAKGLNISAQLFDCLQSKLS